jgi:hypothetical protein
MANKGSAGVVGAAGCRKQSLICSKQFNGCGKTTRLDTILEDMEATKAIELYKSRYETAVDLHQRNITKQTKLTDTFKRDVSTQESFGEPKQPEIAEPTMDYKKLYEELKQQFQQQATLVASLTATIESLNTKLDQLTESPTPAEATKAATKKDMKYKKKKKK